MDDYGRPVQTNNAKSQITKLGWDEDHNVIRLEEANGAKTAYGYDAKTGYPTETRGAGPSPPARRHSTGVPEPAERIVADLHGRRPRRAVSARSGMRPFGDLKWWPTRTATPRRAGRLQDLVQV